MPNYVRWSYDNNKKNFIIIQAVYACIAVLILTLHLANLEEYESVLSAFIAHEYAPLSPDYGLLDINTLFMPLLSWLNGFFKGVQLYGYFVFWASFAIGWVFLKVVHTLGLKFKRVTFWLEVSFVMLHIPNLLSLSVTRLTFLLAVVFFLAYHFNLYPKLKLAAMYLLGIFFRIDLMVLLTVTYLFTHLIAVKKSKLQPILILIISLSIFSAYNVLVSKIATEPFKTFYYHELDFNDRDNINYSQLNDTQQLIVEMGKNGIIDELLFDQNFINEILYSRGFFLTNVLFAPKLFLNVLAHSLETLYHSIWLILFCLGLIVFQIRSSGHRDLLLQIFLILFPLLICFYISLPNRFIYPYYSIFSLFLISRLKEVKSPFYLLFPIALLVSYYSCGLNSTYKQMSERFTQTMEETAALQVRYGVPLIFDNAFYTELSFFNPSITYKYTNNKFLFLNAAFFQAFQNYQESWERYQCDYPLSIKEKIITAQKLQKPIIFTSVEKQQAYQSYLMKRYTFDKPFEFVILQ